MDFLRRFTIQSLYLGSKLFNGWSSRMQRGANFTIVSQYAYKNFAKHHVCSSTLSYPTNFLIKKILSKSSLNKTEKFPTWEKCEIVNFSWLLFSTLMISRNLLIQKYHISKWSSNTFYFINCLSIVLWILCVKMKSFVCEERVLPQNKRNFFPSNLVLYAHNDNYKTKLVLI